MICFHRFLSHSRAAGDKSKDNQPHLANSVTGPGGSFQATQNDDIQALYKNHIASINQISSRASNCGWGKFTCRLTGECIPQSRVCDSVVNCADSSDETQCTCVSRLDKRKLCDGYIDCPDASDEVGCFGCNQMEMSCYHNSEEFLENNQMRMCFSKAERCDGVPKCFTGKDEEDCSRILIKRDTVIVVIHSHCVQ